MGSNVTAIVMDLPEAQKEFLALVNKINDVSISTRFHNWIKTNWLYESTSRKMKMNILLLFIPNWFNCVKMIAWSKRTMKSFSSKLLPN